MSDLAARVSACTEDVLSWMRFSRLRAKHGQDRTYSVSDFKAAPSTVYVNQGWIREHIAINYSPRFWCLHRLRPVNEVSRSADGRGLLCRSGRSEVFVGLCHPLYTLETLVVSLALTRLNYGKATLAGIPSNLLRRLQAV